jgi:hypothetical protein
MNDKIPYFSANSNEDIDFLILISKHNAEKITADERKRLDELIGRSKINLRLFEILTDKNFRRPLQDVVNNL